MDEQREKLMAARDAIMKRLEAYRESGRDIENQTEMIERLNTKMEGMGVREISDLPRAPSPTYDRLGDLMAQKLEVEAEIAEALDHRKEERRYIEELLRTLKSADERGAIRFRYLIGMEWRDVAKRPVRSER